MPKFGALISSLAAKAGIVKEDPTLAKLLAFSEVSQTDVPDDFSNALEQNLLTTDSAIANTTVRNHLLAEALNGIDLETDKIIDAFEFDDTTKGKLKGIQKRSHEKIRQTGAELQNLLKAAKEKANKTGNPEDKKEVEVLKKEIEAANKKMADMQTAHQGEIENLNNKNMEDRKEFRLTTLLASKKLPNNGLDPEINILTAKTLVNRELAKHGLVVDLDGAGQPVLMQVKDGAKIKFFENNKEIDYPAFIDGVLARNKFVEVSDQNPNNPGGGITPPGPGETGPKPNQQVLDDVSQQLASLGTV